MALRVVLRGMGRAKVRSEGLQSPGSWRGLQSGVSRGSANQVKEAAVESVEEEEEKGKDAEGKKGGGDGGEKAVEVRLSEEEEERKGAVGGFMRGLFGGQEVAANDEFVSEAKKAGIDLPPPPPPPRRKDLLVVKRKKAEEDDEGREQTIRDRLFSRFAGSSFMRGAMDAKERISETLDESDNPVINFFRDMHARFFSETEMGQVIREIRGNDPNFTVFDFLQHMESDYIPKLLKAYLSADMETLKENCTEEALEVLTASIKEQAKEGIEMDPTILNISDVELMTAKFLQEEPILIVSFTAQQINCVRDRTGQVIEGKPDDIRAVYYAFALAREPDDEGEDEVPTGGTAYSEGGEENEEVEGASDAQGEESKEKKKKKKEEEKKTRKEDGEREVPPWKMLEMAIRGAHSTF